MTYETISYIDGNGNPQEVALQSLSTLGAPLQVRMLPRSHAPSEFRITLPQPPEIEIVIPFKSRCVIYACRQSASGLPNSFGGGSILFQGRRTDNSGSVTGAKVSSEIVISDLFWDLQQLTLMCRWVIPNTNPVQYFNWPDVILFQYDPLGQIQRDGTFQPYNPAPDQTLITTWQQILTLLNFAFSYAPGSATEGVIGQIGDVPEFLPVYVSTYPVRSCKVMECLTYCLRPHPGVFTFVDYTTVPPTVHFRNRTAMGNTNLPYKSTDENGVVHLATDIQPLYHLVPSQVGIFYQVTVTENNKPQVSFESDVWPAGGPFLLTNNYSVSITGPTVQTTIKNFTSAAFSPTDLTFWRTKVPSLKEQAEGGQVPNDGQLGALHFVSINPYDPNFNPKGLQVIDDNGNPIDYLDTYVYWTDESVYDWFVYQGVAAVAIKATVKGFFTYQRLTTVGAGANATNLNSQVTEHEHSVRTILTNMPTAEYTLTQVTNSGEGIPSGLAQAIYDELSVLQWKLKHDIFQVAADENTVPEIIQPGKNVINLVGGDPEWETMNAVPETVTIDFFRTGDGRLAAKTSVTCGPVNFLEPAYLTQLYNLFANRNLRHIDPNQRLTGEASSGETDLTGNDAAENSVPSLEVPLVQQIAGVNNDGTVSQIQTGASDLNKGDQVKLSPICALDASGNPVNGYYAYGPIKPPP